MNGVIITAAIRPESTRKCLEQVILHTPLPRCIMLIDNASPNQKIADLAREYPGVGYARFKSDKHGGLTACWNFGFKYLLEAGCDVVACINDDAYVNETWPQFFEEARGNPNHIMLGPTTNKPGMDYTNYQLAKGPTSGDDAVVYYWSDYVTAKKNSKQYFNVNGFCFALKAATIQALREEYGEVMDQVKYPWGGQEENLGRRLKKLGGLIGVDTRVFVEHEKFCDWRRLGKK